MDELRIDRRDGKVRPCGTCESEIAELVADYDREAVHVYDGKEIDIGKVLEFGV
jgi:predicted PP-loop superfamily ATPase